MGRRWLYSILISGILGSSSFSQELWTIRAYGGLGIGVAAMPSLADYANVLGGPSGERVEDLQSLFDLNGGIEIQISDGWSLGLDYVSASRTIETDPLQPGASWTLEPALHMPTVVVRRLFPSGTIAYGFGAGFGYHSGSLIATPPGLLVGTTYSGSGFGVLAEAVAYTYFDDAFAGMIAVDARYSSIPTLTDSGGNEARTGNGVVATLKTFALTLRFGISFQI